MMPVRVDQHLHQQQIEFSICSLVTDEQEYAGMVASFRAQGFTEPQCEFLYVDNSNGNTFDAYAGLNLCLRAARGRYVILCHQDVLLLDDGIKALQQRIAEMDQHDPRWALLGNAGGIVPGQLAIRISDPSGDNICRGDLPQRVAALDENFIVAKAEANLALSGDLHGFHLYGADLCQIAQVLGWHSYVIDFHLRHNSQGNVGNKQDRENSSFYQLQQHFIEKYQAAFSARWITTTCTKFFISGQRWLNRLMNSNRAKRWAVRWFRKSR